MSPYLYAEYPSGIEGQAILKDAARLPRGEETYYWDATEISKDLASILNDGSRKGEFVQNEEIAVLFEKYSELGQRTSRRAPPIAPQSDF